MDPDMVRQQEEAEREALALAAQRRVNGPAPASPVVLEAQVFETPAPAEAIAPSPPPAAAPVPIAPPAFAEASIPARKSAAVEARVSAETPAAPKKQKPHPARRALPPISARGSRAPAPGRIGYGVLRAVARFLAYALAGAMLGAILGNVAVSYLDVAPESKATVIYSAMGCFAFIYALISILHHEH
jgi:hypothetical protein